MRRLLNLMVFLTLVWGCSPESFPSDAVDVSAALNTLSESEVKAGWTLLFDGESTKGWRRYAGTDFPSGRWRIEDGLLIVGAVEGGMAESDIVTQESFSSFELRLEFKVDSGGNSGIFYRVLEVNETPIWHNAPEYQVLDDPSYLRDGVREVQLTASNYDMHPAVGGTLKPVGEWNSARIMVDGYDVEHWLNGVRVVSYVLLSDDWRDRFAKSKFVDYPEHGRTVAGPIGLQDHGRSVAYRNIEIRRIGRNDK